MTERQRFLMNLTPTYPESTNAKGGSCFKVITPIEDGRSPIHPSQQEDLSRIHVHSLSDRLRCTTCVPAKARMGDSNVFEKELMQRE